MTDAPKRRQRMSFREAMALTNDSLPDGAFWAAAHKLAGLEYGDGFDELLEEVQQHSDAKP